MPGDDDGLDPGSVPDPAAGRVLRTIPSRRSPSLSFGDELAVLVEVRSDVGVQFGFIRSIGSTGCLLELGTPPRLGSCLSVKFEGLPGSRDAPAPRELQGYAQHALLWRLGSERRRLRLLAVKWVAAAGVS